MRGCPDVCVDRRKILRLVNRHTDPLQISKIIHKGGQSKAVGKVLQPGEEWAAPTSISAETAEIVIEASRTMDVVVPRGLGVIRHAGRKQEIDWMHYFGLGFVMSAARPLYEKRKQEQTATP